VFGAQFYIMEQLGFRKVVDTTFMMSFLLSAGAGQQDTERYFRALRRAQQEIDLEPEPHKHYYARELPA
jgi:NitT/TauT family transport system substrate-binding protein